VAMPLVLQNSTLLLGKCAIGKNRGTSLFKRKSSNCKDIQTIKIIETMKVLKFIKQLKHLNNKELKSLIRSSKSKSSSNKAIPRT